ncbi:MAG: glucokinase [Tepidiformaceae bacterium]
MTTILAGDVGGTKTVVALFKEAEGALRLVRDMTLPSREFAGLGPIIRHFLETGPRPKIDAACFGVAGAVIDGRCEATNLPWALDKQTLLDTIPTPRVMLLNDLEAAAWGLMELPPGDLMTLQAGLPRTGNMALIAAGTGLGEALIVCDGMRRIVVASEGGHADFAPRTELESELLAYLRGEFGHVSYERVLSGPGLFNIYRFLRERSGVAEPQWLKERMDRQGSSATISEVALAGEHPLCVEALDLFAGIYGAEAGNLALKALAVGGVYVGGGIAPKIRAKLADGTFLAAFHDKGRFARLMESIPVRLALDPRAPLLGAARVASGAHLAR